MLICGSCFGESFTENFSAHEKPEHFFSVWNTLSAITICLRTKAQLRKMSSVSCLSELTLQNPKKNRMLISCTNYMPKLRKKQFKLWKNETSLWVWNTSWRSEVDKANLERERTKSFPLQIGHYVSKRSLRASFATRPWLVFIQLNQFFLDFSPFCPVFCNPCGTFRRNFSIANQAKHIINSEINISVMSKLKMRIFRVI